MKNNFKILLITIVIGLIGCETKSKNVDNADDMTVATSSISKLSELWETLPLKSLPMIDSTNFDNVKLSDELVDEQLELLQIGKVYPNFAQEGYHYIVTPSYKLEISENFYSIVVIVQKGDHELETVLLNYDSEENLSSYKVIAYDEIAEGLSRIYSKLEKKAITVTEETYLDEKKVETHKFHINRNGEFNEVRTQFSSNMRPNTEIILNKIYTDTIEFNAYNDDGDYWFMIGKKKDKDVHLNYNWEYYNQEKYNFKYGDILKVQWKMDSIFIEGDGGTLDFSESAIEAVKIKSRDETKPVKFLWRDDQYDEEVGDKVNMIIINDALVSSLSVQEKAALGYVATFIGNDCWWDEGKADENRSNLKCKILTALDLGYQCSDNHLGFLRKWFSKDDKSLKELENCGTMPYTATQQTTFDEIIISKDKINKTIIVAYKAYGINFREARKWSWNQTDTFEYDAENIKLINSDKSELVKETIEMGGN